MWGALIGLLFLTPLFGAAMVAGAGALSGKFTDIGINDQFMKDMAAALCVLVRKVTADKVLQPSLRIEQEARINEAFKAG